MIRLIAELVAAYVVIGGFLIFYLGPRWRKVLDRAERHDHDCD